MLVGASVAKQREKNQLFLLTDAADVLRLTCPSGRGQDLRGIAYCFRKALQKVASGFIDLP